MNAVLVANWNAVVGSHDTVHVLGDVAMGRREESMPLIGRLAGHKILYPGNHDRCWYGHEQRALDLEQEYLDAGFEAGRRRDVAAPRARPREAAPAGAHGQRRRGCLGLHAGRRGKDCRPDGRAWCEQLTGGTARRGHCFAPRSGQSRDDPVRGAGRRRRRCDQLSTTPVSETQRRSALGGAPGSHTRPTQRRRHGVARVGVRIALASLPAAKNQLRALLSVGGGT